jgi:hypothetical protein
MAHRLPAYIKVGRIFRAAALGLLLLVAAGGCAVGAPSTFTLASASVEATYLCPAGVTNAPYDVQATIDVRNGTSSRVTIKSVNAIMTLAAIKGGWLERVGDRYEASGVAFSPDTVGAGSAATLRVIIPSACTNGKTAAPGSSYGDYSVTLTVVTSSGTQTISSKNRHRIVAT